MRFTSYLPGFRGFSSAMDGLEATDDSDFDACAVALARSGAFGSEANRCCEHNSKPVQRISRAQARTGEERRFIRDPWVGRELYTTSGPITTAIALLRAVKVLSHLGEVPGPEARAFFRRIIGSACWKDGKSKARRSICSPQRQAPQSPARSSSGRVWSTGKSKARFCSYQGTPARAWGKLGFVHFAWGQTPRLPSRAKLGLSQSPTAARLAPGRPDEGVWACVCA